MGWLKGKVSLTMNGLKIHQLNGLGQNSKAECHQEWPQDSLTLLRSPHPQIKFVILLNLSPNLSLVQLVIVKNLSYQIYFAFWWKMYNWVLSALFSPLPLLPILLPPPSFPSLSPSLQLPCWVITSTNVKIKLLYFNTNKVSTTLHHCHVTCLSHAY